MSQLLLKMAQQAGKDSSLLASLVRGYAEREGLSWEQIASQLGVEAGQLAQLALCKRPQNQTLTQDLDQIAAYVGIDAAVLARFLHRAENIQPLPGKARQRPAFRQATAVMFRRPVWALGMAALIILFLGTLVFAQPAGAEATLVVSEGQAVIRQSRRTLLSRQIETVIAAGAAITVGKGDTIKVGAASTAQLHLQDGGTVELFAGTTLAIAELITDEDTYQVQLDMFAGKTINRVVRLLRAGDGYEVHTPSSTASVRGTVFTVEVISREVTYVAVDEGTVHVTTGDQQVDVRVGNEVTATTGEPLEVKPQGNVEPASPPDLVPGNSADDAPGNPSDGDSAPLDAPTDQVPDNPPDDVPGKTAEGDELPGAPPDQVPGNPPDDTPGNPPDAGGDPPAAPPDQVPGNPPDDTPGNPPDAGGDPPGGPPDEVPGNPPDDTPGNPPDAGGDPPGAGNGNGNGNGNGDNNGNGNGNGDNNGNGGGKP